jgi:type II protein arginine methyltransferase
MSSWNKFATLSALVTSEDISKQLRTYDATANRTPIPKIVADAKGKGYDTVCVPLTTEKWKTRWMDMCILPPGGERDRDVAAEERAEAWRSKPAFLAEEVTITYMGTSPAPSQPHT